MQKFSFNQIRKNQGNTSLKVFFLAVLSITILIGACKKKKDDTTPTPVTVAVTSVTLSPTSTTVAVGATTTLTATVMPQNASNKAVSWTTSDASKATVNANGVVTGVAAGSATITVTTADGSKKAVATVTVVAASDILKQFTYNNHTYYVIKVAKNWVDATVYANQQFNGYLVEINDQKEQTEIETQLNGLNFSGLNLVSDGGGIQYLWIGARKRAGDDWYWDGNNDGSNSDIKIGSGRGMAAQTQPNTWVSTTGIYQNWGKPGASMMEPDNYTDPQLSPNGQNAGAIGLNAWPNGAKYQWNDIAGSNTIWFIIEKN